MNNPELYSKCNAMTRAAAIECLDEFKYKINWIKNADNAADLGCGDGSVTQIIKKYMPSKYKKVVACDINETMIKFASNCDEDKRTTYRVLDIEGEFPLEMKGEYNHVFSFFTLHWMRDQEKAFRNIYDLLTEGGDCLLTFLGYTPIYHIFNNLGQTSKWSSSWLKDLGCFISPYYGMQDPESILLKMLKAIGFKDIEIQNKRITYLLENGLELKNLIQSVEPYHMPKHVFDDFIGDCVVAAEDIGLLETTAFKMEDYNKKIEYTYNLIVIYAKKH